MSLALKLALAALTLAAALIFALSGAGGARPELTLLPSLAELLGSAAGHPLWLLAAVAFGLTLTGLLAQPAEDADDDEDPDAILEPPRFPLSELALVAMAALALFFITLCILGVAHGWRSRSLGVVFGAGALECIFALGVGMSLAVRGPRSRRLYIAGLAGTATSLALLSATAVFMGGR